MKPQFALSTWSLHRQLGFSYPDAPDKPGEGRRDATWGAGTMSLLDVPAAAKAKGLGDLQICHFHLNRHDRGFLIELKSAIDTAGVSLEALLVDEGDLNHPVYGQRDTDWVRRWIDIGAFLGAQTVRVIAGKQVATEHALQRSVDALAQLVAHGASMGTSVSTENWFATTAGPREVIRLLEEVPDLRFLIDLGNWTGANKYADLSAIGRLADFSHAKCEFRENLRMESDDFAASLKSIWDAGYGAKLGLVYDGPSSDEWGALEMERAFIEQLCESC